MRWIGRWSTILLAVTAGCSAAPLASISWSDAAPRSGEVSGDTLTVQSPAGGGTFPLISFTTTFPDGTPYALEGKVRYEGVTGEGYLEMWNDFPPARKYFSRTLAPTGPQGVITGDSDWRDFQLPFDPGDGPAPARLDLNLVLPGAGTVEIGPLSVRAVGGGSAWWSDRTAGGIGASAGVLIGLLGATLGVLASRGKARAAVLATMMALAIVGGAAIAVGVVALLARQPYAVVFPMLLLGTILVAVFGGGYRAVRRGYEAAELRKMRALDAAGV
jgi:hypothetical protein